MRRLLLFAAVLFCAAGVAAAQQPGRSPTDDEIDETVTLEGLLEPGDDSLRWDKQSGVEIVGFVIDVHPPLPVGSCPPPRADAETVLELTTDLNILDPAHRVFAIVTTGWRQKKAAAGKVWSTSMLQARFFRRKVRIRGWLQFANDQAPCSVNTGDMGVQATRATAWQIRPVTAIVLADPAEPGPIP